MNIEKKYLSELEKEPIILGTRDSALALWQANYIKNKLESFGVKIELKGIKTRGDKILDAPLAKIGGKGLFTKELENELISGGIDFAVHSLKDVPVTLEPRLMLSAITKRADCRDCFVSVRYKCLQDLPFGAKVGTTSLRRSMQLKKIRKDLDTQSLRGNVQTRLNKLKNDEFDAIILANAGIQRLELQDSINFISPFSTDELIPAMGQGALGLECRAPKYSSNFRDQAILKLLELLHDEDSSFCCMLERAFIALLGGGCQSPIGVYAKILDDKNIEFSCIIGNLDASKILTQKKIFSRDGFEYEIQELINSLKIDGVDEILNEVHEKLR